MYNPALASSATIRSTCDYPPNATRIDAIALDYTGEAGGRQSLVSYDEPWGIMSERARRLFEELDASAIGARSVGLDDDHGWLLGESQLLELALPDRSSKAPVCRVTWSCIAPAR